MWGLGSSSDLRTEDQSAQLFRSHRGEVRKGFCSAGSHQGTRPPKGLRADLAAAASQARALGLRRRLRETRYGRVCPVNAKMTFAGLINALFRPTAGATQPGMANLLA